MATYYSLRDGLITDTSTYGMSISSVEKTTNTSAYTLTTNDNWSTVLSSATTDVIDSIAVHLSSRAANPVGVLSAEIALGYAGFLTKIGTGLSATSPFTTGEASSIYFPGTTNNYLRAPEVVLGANNFTVEFWAYLTTSTASQHFIGQWGTGGTGYSWGIYTSNDTNRFLRFLVSSTGNVELFIQVTTTQIPLNTWVHIALTRDTGGVYRIFLNGTLCGNGSITNPAALYNATSDLTIGAGNQGLFLFSGYMSNIRIVNGTALYTSNFTPSASPLTPVTNTAFLYQFPYINAYNNNVPLSNTLVGTYPISSFTSYDGSNNTVATYPLNWQLLKLSAPFTKSSGLFSLNLKTSDANQLALMALSTVNGVDYDRMVIRDFYVAAPPINLHIGNIIDGYTTQNRTITANTTTLNSIFVHKNGSLKFSDTSSTLTVSGSNGLQITSEGSVEIGTSTTPVPKDITHQIILSNNHIGVSNGGRLDVYGAYKVPYTKLTTPSIATARTFTVVDNVSSNWQVNDTVVFTPNTAQSTSYDTLVLSSFDSDTTFRTTASAAFAHTVLDHVPNVANLTRNVKIGGTSNTARGYVAARGGATVNINNAEFKFIDTGLTTGVDSNGLFTVSGCTLSGSGAETLLSPIATEYSTEFNVANGTNPYLISGQNNTGANISVGTDFTFEFFFKPFVLGTGVDSRLVQFANFPWYASNNFSDIGFGVQLYPTEISFAAINGSGVNDRSTVSSPISNVVKNKWNHLAVTGESGSLKLYINGKLTDVSPQVTWNYANSFVFTLGLQRIVGGYAYRYNGKMSNLRFVKGRAMYTSNFIPPTSPLTEITDTGVSTAILTLQDNPPIDRSYKNSVITTNAVVTELDSPFGKETINASINNNVVFKPSYGISLDNVASDNSTITKNLLLSSKDAGIYVNDGLKGDLTFNSNIAVGPSPYGSFIENNTVGKTLSGLVNYNNTTGMFINNAHAGLVDNVISTHNSTIGILVDGTISQLNETTFTNITASNNRTLGFRVSGNPVDHLSPITLNINRLVANNNLSGGFEGYCITGNLTALELNRNGIYGMKTSIGNYYTTIDGITALMNNVASTSAGIGILSGLNYYPTVIKDANIDGANKSGISLDSTNFSQFYVYNSTVSGAASDFNIIASRNVLEGSYLISNTNVGPLPIGIGITSNNYQSDVLKTAGFAFTNMNNASGFNTTFLAAGTRAVDSTIKGNISATTSPSERLTPQSTSLKLRSGSKFVALDAGQSTRVSVFVRKSNTTFGDSATYNGSSPRLMLKRNGAMGINSDMVMGQLDTIGDEFLKLSGTTQTVTDAGVLEFYVDCDGTTGWINIDNWTAN